MKKVVSNRFHEVGSNLKWPVKASQTIEAPMDRVWEIISTPGNLELCHPFCLRNPVHVWPGAESRDEVHYLSGWVFERKFFNWINGVGYDLEIGRRGGRKSTVSWRLAELERGATNLQITVYPGYLLGVPAIFRWIPHFASLAPRLNSYLSSVVKGFEWYLTRGEAVPRNQFVRHPWFSEPKPQSPGKV